MIRELQLVLIIKNKDLKIKIDFIWFFKHIRVLVKLLL